MDVQTEQGSTAGSSTGSSRDDWLRRQPAWRRLAGRPGSAVGPDPQPGWTHAEWDVYVLGPFDGHVPGLVRRVRRILDVSQRGLAALLDVSQSAVARWETGRTSPRADVLHGLLRLAGLGVSVHDAETGEEVPPMRDDGARDHAGRRYPAHTDLRVVGWWQPRSSVSTTDFLWWRKRSRARRDPNVRYCTDSRRRSLERLMWGTPDDHPAVHQLAAEAEHQDERRKERQEERRRRSAAEPAPG